MFGKSMDERSAVIAEGLFEFNKKQLGYERGDTSYPQDMTISQYSISIFVCLLVDEGNYLLYVI